MKIFYISYSPFRRKKFFIQKNLYYTTLLLYFLHIMNHFAQQRFIKLNVSNIMLMASFWVYFTLVWIQRRQTGVLIIQFYERCQKYVLTVVHICYFYVSKFLQGHVKMSTFQPKEIAFLYSSKVSTFCNFHIWQSHLWIVLIHWPNWI